MKPLSSSSTASNVLGAVGSSESRKKPRSPPRENSARSGRSALGTPPSSKGTRRSGVSPATTPTRVGIAMGTETSFIANDQKVFCCRLIVNKGRNKEDCYEAGMTSMKTELTALTAEVGALRARAMVRAETDATLFVECQSVERERDELRSKLVEVEKQLAAAQQGAISLTTRCGAAPEDAKVMLETEHAVLLKRRKDELLADMNVQFVKGHAATKKQTAEAVEAAVAGLKSRPRPRRRRSSTCRKLAR